MSTTKGVRRTPAVKMLDAAVAVATRGGRARKSLAVRALDSAPFLMSLVVAFAATLVSTATFAYAVPDSCTAPPCGGPNAGASAPGNGPSQVPPGHDPNHTPPGHDPGHCPPGQSDQPECQQASPSVAPTGGPTSAPTTPPSADPTTPPTGGPTSAPTTSPSTGPTTSLSPGPTAPPATSGSTSTPTPSPSVPPVIPTPTAPPGLDPETDGSAGAGGPPRGDAGMPPEPPTALPPPAAEPGPGPAAPVGPGVPPDPPGDAPPAGDDHEPSEGGAGVGPEPAPTPDPLDTAVPVPSTSPPRDDARDAPVSSDKPGDKPAGDVLDPVAGEPVPAGALPLATAVQMALAEAAAPDSGPPTARDVRRDSSAEGRRGRSGRLDAAGAVPPAFAPLPTQVLGDRWPSLEVLAETAIETVRRFGFPILLMLLVGLYLVAQGKFDDKDPKLVKAPVRRDPEIFFERAG